MAVAAPPPLPSIEIALPSLEPYAAGNTGIPYAWTFTAGRAGPHVLLQALTHGNEACGAIALDRLFREGVAPARGTLTLAFANTEAYTMLEAAGFSAVTAEALKYAAGRERPDETTDPTDWRDGGRCVASVEDAIADFEVRYWIASQVASCCFDDAAIAGAQDITVL